MAQKSMTFDQAAIVTVNVNGYRIRFLFMSKSEASYRIETLDLSEKSE